MWGRRGAKPNNSGLAVLLAIGALCSREAPLFAQPPSPVLPATPVFADCIPAPEAAIREIRIGSCVRSTLGTSDPTNEDGDHYEDYRVTLRSGEAVRIDMDGIPPTSGLDTYLEIRGSNEESLGFNDDRADSLNSTLIFSAPAAGDYVVRARALTGRTGDYALRVGAAPATQIREFQLGGEPVRSTLEVNDALEGDRRYEEYSLRLRAGEVVQIDMLAVGRSVRGVGEQFLDPYLTIFAPDSNEQFRTNDDRGGSLDARLVFVVPNTGVYRVRAQGFSNSVGDYALAATRLAELPRPNILAGDHVEGVWEDGSPATEQDGRPIRYQEYRFDGTRGERVQIDATSTLHPRLRLAPADGIWFAEHSPMIRRRATGRIARVTAVLPATGSYIVRLEVPGSQNGTFDLRLTRRRDATLDDPPRLDRRQPTEGRLGLDSGLILRDGSSGQVDSFYRIYALTVAGGETVTVTLESSDFDPVLDAGTMSSLGYAVAQTNDDSEGPNSRLVLRQPRRTTIFLRARSLGGDIGEGRFTLRAVQGSPEPAPAAR